MLNFLRKFRSKAKSLTSPTDEEFALLTGMSLTGTSVGMLTALSVPAVSSAVRVISEAAASLEPRVMDGVSEVKDHPIGKLLRGSVNSYTSGFELVRDLVAQALTHDKGGIAYVNRVVGEIREITVYDTAHVTVTFSGDGRREPSYKINNRDVDAADIIHVRGPFDRSAVSLASDAIATAKSMERHAKKLFENGAKPGGVIEMEKSLGDEGLKKMKAGWKAAHEGADNAGKTAILWDGAKFKSLAMDSTDAQFLENRTFQILEIARAFRVPPSMLFELERVTWSNGEQMGLEFLTYCLEPWLKVLEAALNRALLTDEERGNLRIEFGRDDLTRADLGARATAYSSLISARVLNPNEARAWEGLAPYDGGDEFANPHTGSNQPGDTSTPPAKEAANAA